MARTKGAKGKLGVDLRDKISHAFDTVNGPDNAGLIALSKSDPAIFYGLVSRCIPADVSHNVTVALVSLGDAMEAARDRLENMGPATVIDARDARRYAVIDVQQDDEIPQPIDNKRESDLTQ